MYAPSKPSSFRRSSEAPDSDIQARAEEKRLREAEAPRLREQSSLEDLSFGFSTAAKLDAVTPVELEARRYSCRSEDLSTYDVDGVVR